MLQRLSMKTASQNNQDISISEYFKHRVWYADENPKQCFALFYVSDVRAILDAQGLLKKDGFKADAKEFKEDFFSLVDGKINELYRGKNQRNSNINLLSSGDMLQLFISREILEEMNIPILPKSTRPNQRAPDLILGNIRDARGSFGKKIQPIMDNRARG